MTMAWKPKMHFNERKHQMKALPHSVKQ